MKLDPANPIESQLWRDVFLSWLKDWGGPAYSDSGNEQARIAAGRHADLAVETMRERMSAPPRPDIHAEAMAAYDAIGNDGTYTRARAPATPSPAPREVLPADERITPVVLAWLRALACALATPRAREYLFDLFAVVEAAHCGLVSRETALCDAAWSKLEAFALSSKTSTKDILLVRAVSLAVDRDIRRLSGHPNDMWTACPMPEQAPARVTAERLHVAPGWVSSAAGIRKAIDGAADRGDVIVVDIRVDDENVAQWVLGVPEQAEVLVAALLSAGVQA